MYAYDPARSCLCVGNTLAVADIGKLSIATKRCLNNVKRLRLSVTYFLATAVLLLLPCLPTALEVYALWDRSDLNNYLKAPMLLWFYSCLFDLLQPLMSVCCPLLLNVPAIVLIPLSIFLHVLRFLIFIFSSAPDSLFVRA